LGDFGGEDTSTCGGGKNKGAVDINVIMEKTGRTEVSRKENEEKMTLLKKKR